RQELEENLVTHSPDFQNTFEPSNASIRVVNAPREPYSLIIHQPPQELSIPEMEDLKQQYLDELKHLSNLEYRDEVKIAELTQNFNVSSRIFPNMCVMCLFMIILRLSTFQNTIEDLSESNEEFSSTDDDSFCLDNIDYVEASPLDSELVSSEIDSLFDEFAGELTLLKSIPPGIDETGCHPKEETHFTKRLLYDNSSPHPPKEFVFDNSNADIKSFSPSPIPIKDSDSHMEEIDLSLNLDEPNSRGFTKNVVENISPMKEPQVLTVLPTHSALKLNIKFQSSIVPPYLLSLRNEDIIFDPGI
nr:hypothetical protein [Tanacetum cinerariifolium]